MDQLTAAQKARIDRLLALSARASETLGEVAWLGHLRIDSGGRQTDVLLGRGSRTGPALALVDWREAPIAELFFTHGEGDAYELDLGGRAVVGRLLERELAVFESGELVEIEAEGELLSRRGGSWVARARPDRSLLPEGAGSRALAPGEVKLDPQQQRLVDLPRARQLLILGEGGFGKTTVALRRLVSLRAGSPIRFKAAVIVPTEGLRRLTRLLLDQLGAEEVEVDSFDRWAGNLARKAFRDLPRRESGWARSGVVHLKRHPALRELLPRIAARPAVDEDGAPLGPRTRHRARRTDLHHLFGDRALLGEVAARAGAALPASAVADVVEHTRVQFGESAETSFGHVEPDRLAALDGRPLDEGTPDEDVNTTDPEDYAVMFELDRLRCERLGAQPAKLPRYDCLVVDEAQELAPIELALLGRALAPGGTLIVAGDAGQQLDASAAYSSWDATMRGLGVGRWQAETLSTSHRCPPEVTTLARAMRQPTGAAQLVAGGAIAAVRADHELQLTAWLVEELRALRLEQPKRSIAVICRDAQAARSWARNLRHGVEEAVLSLEGQFDFKPGVVVTSAPEVKGLEFDHVVVPDCSPAAYPDLPEARRALYVVLTRPTRSLALATVGRWSPLISASSAVTG